MAAPRCPSGPEAASRRGAALSAGPGLWGGGEGTRGGLTALPALSTGPGVPPPAAHGVPDGGAAGDAPDAAPDVPGLRREGADAARG